MDHSTKRIPVFFNWSGGKDSSLALYRLLQDESYEVVTLVTTVNAEHQRISMHGVRRELLHEQARLIGIPVHEILLPDSPNMSDYEAAMEEGMLPLLEQGIRHCAFGDIFLEDLRAYREKQLEPVGVKAIFPLWGENTSQLIREFIDLQFKTTIVCAQADKLDATFVGRTIDPQFLNDLPADVDPCGENGEFHTFVSDGPIFKKAVRFTLGETVFRTYGKNEEDEKPCGSTAQHAKGFYYKDLIFSEDSSIFSLSH